MGIDIKENTRTVNFMEREDIYGQMAHVMKDNSKKDFVMDKEAGDLHKTMEIHISVDTKRTKRMAMAGMSGQMAALTKDNFPMM